MESSVMTPLAAGTVEVKRTWELMFNAVVTPHGDQIVEVSGMASVMA